LKSYKIDTRSDQEEVLNKLLERIEQKEQKPVRKISWYMTAAASVAATAILNSFWLFTATETIQCRGRRIDAFRLPDDSRIVLHDGSTLTHPVFLES
jgi:hypothetical protein